MLKSLQLAGFKSFADKTRLEFPAGVTAVVGPNGSGKSNVVDAVKWVLGSQSPRSLRGQDMTDVIFNGSAKRGPMGSAEVTLAFDNSVSAATGRRLFDLDEPEVRLTRRVSRGGDGEYLVNGHACRLKDFRELLAGTGVGAESYSIIEQGRVDAALRASPLERRLLLEEAAGVSRFRLKKREAAKRLERVEQNLLRLSDIVDEVEGRLRRVRSQAGKARRYREASLRLKEARTEIASADWFRLDAQRKRIDAERAELAARLDGTRAAVADGDRRLAQLERSAETDAGAQRALREARQRMSRAERSAAVARVELLRAEERRGERVAALLSARRAIADAGPSDESRRALAAAEATSAQYAESLAAAIAAEAQANEDVAALRDGFAAGERRRRRIEAVSRRIDARLTAARRAAAEADAALGRLDDESAGVRSQLTAATAELAEATRRRDGSAEGLRRIDQELAETQQAAARARRDLTEAQRREADQREALAGLRHRLEAIVAEERRLERLNTDVRGLVERASAAGEAPPRVFGLVADLIHVEADFVPMVEAALGDRAEHVVIDARGPLLSALGDSAESLTTRAGFQPLDAPPGAAAIDQIDLTGEPGVLGRASDFVEVEPRYAALARRLFGRTWFVESLADAARLAESVGRGLSFVTLAGELVAADGALVAGPHDGALRMLTRRQDAEGLAARIGLGEATVQRLAADIAALESSITTHEAAVAETHRRAAAERERFAAASQLAATLDERTRHAAAAAARTESRAARRAAERSIAQRVAESMAGRAAWVGTLASGPDAAPDDAALRATEAAAAAAAARVAELRAAAERHAGLLDSMRREARAGAASDDGLLVARDKGAAAFRESIVEAEQATATALTAAAAAHLTALAVDRAAQRDSQSRAARLAAERVRGEVAAALAVSRAEADRLARALADAQLQRDRIDMERAAVAQRVRDDYGVDVAALPPSEGPPSDPAALRAEIEALRAELQGVGPVNPESLEELDEIETRFAELSTQFRDLSEAKKTLARLTARIDSDSRELFRQTFEAVRGHFRELFARLFAGGEADLVLVDEGPADGSDDSLGGGVEVVARPPGKELRSLSLLSGGEKTMTCVALLLALFRSRPSPFCLLDEVDAALDEANVGRFLEVLKDFLGATQFVVITHSKRTMAGADTIYGVTMQESGVSKQLSVRLEEAATAGTVRLRVPEAAAPARRAA